MKLSILDLKGDVDKLKKFNKGLCVHKNLLNEQLTSQEHLFELLTTKDINTKELSNTFRLQYQFNDLHID